MDLDLALKIGGPVLSAVAGVLAKDLYERRPRLVCFYVHSGAVGVMVDEQEIRFHTHALIVANQGRSLAHNVRLGHNTLPYFEISPPIEYDVRNLPGGAREIVIPVLPAKKTITVNYLYHPPLFWNGVNSYVESDEGPAKVLNVLPTPQWPLWARVGAWALLIYGLFAILYTLAIFVR